MLVGTHRVPGRYIWTSRRKFISKAPDSKVQGRYKWILRKEFIKKITRKIRKFLRKFLRKFNRSRSPEKTLNIPPCQLTRARRALTSKVIRFHIPYGNQNHDHRRRKNMKNLTNLTLQTQVLGRNKVKKPKGSNLSRYSRKRVKLDVRVRI